MRCTNDRCHLASSFFLHKKCSDKLEENLLKILANEGSARGWTGLEIFNFKFKFIYNLY